jgi:hypothetical protein
MGQMPILTVAVSAVVTSCGLPPKDNYATPQVRKRSDVAIQVFQRLDVLFLPRDNVLEPMPWLDG